MSPSPLFLGRRVEVASTGQVVSMRTTPKLSAPVLAAVEANLRKLRFAPPMKDGRAVSGVTFVQQEVCVATAPGHHRFTVKMRGNGPSLDQRDPLEYPRGALIDGREGRFKVTFAIGADGQARLIDISRTAGGGSDDNDFREALEAWVGAMHFQPELLDGQPVATRVSDEVDFALGGDPRKVQAGAERKPSEGSDACQLALDAHNRPSFRIALNSPFSPLAAD